MLIHIKNRIKLLEEHLRDGSFMWQYALLPDGTDTKREYNVWKTEAQSHFIKLDEDSQEEFLCLQDDIAANLYKEFTEKGITCKPEDFFVLRTADMIFEDWDN